MLFGKMQTIIADYRRKYAKLNVEIIGFTSEKETDYKLVITYSEYINEQTHLDFFKSNGVGACIVVKTISFLLKNSDIEMVVSTDRTPMFKKHGWSDSDIEEYLIK
jgi:hypothetical protein